MHLKYQLENFNGSYDFRSGHHTDWQMEAHIHEYSELLYCQKGTGDVFVNGKHIRLPEKHLVWIHPNSIHAYHCLGADVICAVFSHDLIPLYFEQTRQLRPVVAPVDVSDMADILDSFPSLDKKDPILISGYLNLLCARVMQRSAFAPTDTSDSLLYQRIISYLSEHFHEDISLSSLAKTFGYNEKYLSHCLHTLTGIHFSRLLSLYRIQHAKALLSHRQANIAQVAIECGFSAINTFNRVFKSMTGMTPSQYKKLQRQRTVEQQPH